MVSITINKYIISVGKKRLYQRTEVLALVEKSRSKIVIEAFKKPIKNSF